MNADVFPFETTDLSLIHRLAERKPGGVVTASKRAAIFCGSALGLYLPILLSAIIDPVVPLVSATPSVKVPFLRDWNVACLCVLSFPTLVVLLIGDQTVLLSALTRVSRDGVLLMTPEKVDEVATRWRLRFRKFNLSGQLLGLITGGAVVYANFKASTSSDFGSWVAPAGTLRPAGVLLLVGLFLFYALVTVYAVRGFAVALLLRDVTFNSELELLPWHPDRCGGLRPIGAIGLRNQFVLSVLGLNVVLLGVVTIAYLGNPRSMVPLLVAAAGAYTIFGPLVFMGPLLPFRRAMSDTKSRMGADIAQRMGKELRAVVDNLSTKPIPAGFRDTVEQLTELGRVVDALPVWPLDLRTVGRFLVAYVVPVVAAIGVPIVETSLSVLARRLGIG